MPPSAACATLAQLVAIPSVSGDEAAVADTAAQFAADAGFSVQRQGNNVWFELGSSDVSRRTDQRLKPPRRLLLHSHLDTVPPCAGWTDDPWTPVVADGRLIGLGANDAKGCATAILHAAAQLRREGWDGPGTLVCALTAEEETGGPGGICSVLERFGALDAAVFGEPTGLAPCTAQGGMLLLKCRAQGLSGHVAHAARLRLTNAIHMAARDVTRLAGLDLPEYVAFDGQAIACCPQVTLISGGISANQVPDACEFRVDLRTTPGLDHAALLAQLSAELESEVECLSLRYRPVATAADERIVQAALAAAGRPAFYSGTVSDWSLVPGVPAVKLGPGESARSHQPDEYLLEDELSAGIACYVDVVRRYFSEAAHG
jgi:acetylornithine deacetylase